MEQTSLGRIFHELGADGFDEAFVKVCERCSLQGTCKEKCNALAIIGAMAVNASMHPVPRMGAFVFLENLKKATSDIKR